ncbi:MAG: DNA/RNA non-specific endonuclease [Porphyrobacter sp.]|nr:DNA/RNA non-specific endonuclease [Porphyrobacter sp.]
MAGANSTVIDGSYASSTFEQETRGTIGQGTVTVAVPGDSTPLDAINRDVTQAQVVTKDEESGFTVYASESAAREVGALVSEDRDSVIIGTGRKLGDNPIGAIEDAADEAAALTDGIAQNSATEMLFNQLGHLLGVTPQLDAVEAQARIVELAEQRYEASLETLERELGRPATEEEKAQLQRISRGIAKATVGISQTGMADVDALTRDGGSGGAFESTSEAGGAIVVDGDVDDRSTGDTILKVTADAGRWLKSIDPTARDAVEKALDVAFGSPVKAVAGWTIEYGLQKVAENNPELMGQLGAYLDEAGIWAIEKLSVDDEETARWVNDADKRDVAGGHTDVTEIDAIFEAASTILGVDIPGLGKGGIPKIDRPDISHIDLPGRTITVDVSRATKGTPEYDLLNSPPPNARIELSNGTTFRTNESGYVEEITYQPLDSPGARDARQTDVGKEGIEGDIGGHAQACRHGGTCDRYNLFPQNSNFNSSGYRQWENEITRALQNGDDVGPITITFDRSNPANPRPDTVDVAYTINGRKSYAIQKYTGRQPVNPIEEQKDLIDKLYKIVICSCPDVFQEASYLFEYVIFDDGSSSVGQEFEYVSGGTTFFATLNPALRGPVMELVEQLHAKMKEHTGGDWRSFRLTINENGSVSTKFEYLKA